jgi:hypothetical protein
MPLDDPLPSPSKRPPIGLFALGDVASAASSDRDDAGKRVKLISRSDLVQETALLAQALMKPIKRGLLDEPLSTDSASAKSSFTQVTANLLGRAIQPVRGVRDGHETLIVHVDPFLNEFFER